MSADELKAIDDFRERPHAALAGEVFVEEHTVNTKLYTLYSGWAFRFKTLSDGRRQILQFLLAGDFIGLQDEFADGHTFGVEALTDCALCRFPRDALWDLFREQSRLGYDITWLAARDEKMGDDMLVSNGRRTAQERVAMLLMHLYRRAERVGMVNDGWAEFPLRQQHIADALGLSLVHTNKTLRRLEKIGLYQLDAGALRIADPLALEQLGDYFERPLHASPLL